MMERILLGVLYLSGWLILSKCRQYYFVNQSLTWSQARDYCRQTYTDLATIESTEEMNQLNKTVLSAGYNSEVWIGVYSSLSWHWTNLISDEFWKWTNKYENEPSLAYYVCATVLSNSWYINHYNNCSVEHPFICYNGTIQNPVFLNERMDWFRARRYCRENFTDLIYTWNSDVRIQVPYGDQVWIGLIAHPQISWADGRSSSFRYWDNFEYVSWYFQDLCGVADLQKSGIWSLRPYYIKLPFVCYSSVQVLALTSTEAPKVEDKKTGKEKVQNKVVKLRLKIEDPSVDLNDPTVKAELLRKFLRRMPFLTQPSPVDEETDFTFQEKLKEKGVNGVTLKWREQPDGKVFHKDEENTETEGKKKTEL